jgi:chromosomal replication initiation ATPase DnaA
MEVNSTIIMSAVEEYFGNGVKVISTSRRRTTVIARRIAYFLTFDMTTMSQEEMAIFFDADASGIYRGLKYIKDNYTQFESQITTIRQRVLYDATLITI